MKEETRGIIEKAIGEFRFDASNIKKIQEITPLQNVEEFLLGFALGYILRYSELLVLTESLEKNQFARNDAKDIRAIIYRRLPEIRMHIVKTLNK